MSTPAHVLRCLDALPRQILGILEAEQSQRWTLDRLARQTRTDVLRVARAVSDLIALDAIAFDFLQGRVFVACRDLYYESLGMHDERVLPRRGPIRVSDELHAARLISDESVGLDKVARRQLLREQAKKNPTLWHNIIERRPAHV